MDKKTVLGNFEEDADLIREVVCLFLEECPKQLSAIQEALEQGDAGGVERSAHRLKAGWPLELCMKLILPFSSWVTTPGFCRRRFQDFKACSKNIIACAMPRVSRM